METTETSPSSPTSLSSIPEYSVPPVKDVRSNTAQTPATASIGLVIWMCFLTSVCTLMIGFWGLKSIKNHGSDLLEGSSTPQYVFVDEEKLYALKLKEAMNRPGMSVEKAQEDANAFKVSVDKAISLLAGKQKIVLTKQAVLAGGSSLDVTDQLAVSLGLKP